MVTKKIRTEYMKKFRDPRWETFSKCYEDSVRYRVSRRLMELSHKPWFGDGWDSGSDSSGWSTPRLSRNRVAPLSLPLKQRSRDPMTRPEPKPPAGGGEVSSGEDAARDAASTTAAVVENGVTDAGGLVMAAPNASGPSEDPATDSGPADTASSDGETANPAPRPRHRRRNPRPEVRGPDTSQGDKPSGVRKLPRAKSQPPTSSRDKVNVRASSRLDGTERQTEVRRTPTEGQTPDACVPTQRHNDRTASNLHRRRARSADLEKVMQSQQLAVADDRWMTEYMRCFSARLR